MDLTVRADGASIDDGMDFIAIPRSSQASFLGICSRSAWAAALRWAGLAVLLIASQMGGLHNLLSPHAYCSVHGQMEHLPGVEQAGLDAMGNAPHASPLEVSRERLSTTPEALHDNCGLLLLAKRCNWLAHKRILSSLPDGHSLPQGRLIVREPQNGARLFRLAPKNSPPQLLAA